jgi:hypothetical protein
MIAGLCDSGVDFVVIGGVAARAHGSARITEDLDVCYDPSLANRLRLASLLERWHGYPREVEEGLPFIMDAKTLAISPVLTLITDQGALDLFDSVAGIGSYQDVVKRSVSVDGGEVRFLALGLPALIDAKRAAGRTRDLAQIPELEALLELGGGGGHV